MIVASLVPRPTPRARLPGGEGVRDQHRQRAGPSLGRVGGPVSRKPGLPRLLAGILVLGAAACAFLAATPWLRAYQVAHAPLLLALAAVLPVVISAVASRLTRSSALVSYAMSGTGLLGLLAVSNGFRLLWHMGRPGARARAAAHRDPPTERGELAPGGADRADLALQCACRPSCWSARPARRRSGTAVPAPVLRPRLCGHHAGPAGGTLGEGAALLGALVVCALARQGLIDAEAARAETAGNGARREPVRRRRSWRRTAAGARHGSGAGGGAGSRYLERPGPGRQACHAKPPYAVALGHGRRSPGRPRLAPGPSGGAAARALFSVQVNGRWSGYVPVATLGDYDGDTWTFSSATFRPTGGRVPSPATLAASEPQAQPLLQHYTLESAIGLPFLPALDRPEQVEGLAVDADAATGMLAASPSLPASYSVVSQVASGHGSGLSPVSAPGPRGRGAGRRARRLTPPCPPARPRTSPPRFVSPPT